MVTGRRKVQLSGIPADYDEAVHDAGDQLASYDDGELMAPPRRENDIGSTDGAIVEKLSVDKQRYPWRVASPYQ